jgi:serine/threonine protein kinase
MEECKGGEIFDRIIQRIQTKQMYSEKDAAEIFEQVMSCIQYCHNQKICHRDLKPENLLYSNPESEKGNRIKVIDF